MRNPQELREAILELLENRESNTHKMLKECGYNTSLVNDLKKGQMPSADKIAKIAKFLGVTSDFLLGIEPEPDPADSDSDLDLIESLRREFYGNPAVNLTPDDKKAILDMAKMIMQLKSPPQRQDKAE